MNLHSVGPAAQFGTLARAQGRMVTLPTQQRRDRTNNDTARHVVFSRQKSGSDRKCDPLVCPHPTADFGDLGRDLTGSATYSVVNRE